MGSLEVAQGAEANDPPNDPPNSKTCDVQAVNTPEIAEENTYIDQFGTELGGVQAIDASQIAIVSREITPPGDTKNKLSNPESQKIEVMGATEVCQGETCTNGGSGPGSQGVRQLDGNKQELVLWENKSPKERLLSREYCTQACLLGLKRGSSLDESCPNAASHRISEGSTHHFIDEKAFTRLAREDLAQDLAKSTRVYSVRLSMSGTTGTLFKLMLPSYEYVFVGKGTTSEFVLNLQHEALVYEHRLKSLQGESVPVYLGRIDVDLVIRWAIGADQIVHMMLMSWSGDTISETEVPILEVNRTLQEVILRGVIHNDVFKDSRDWASVRKNIYIWSTDNAKKHLLSQMRKAVCYPNVRRRNMLWNSERKRVMLIDFERSIILDDESDGPDQADQLKKSEQLEHPEHPKNPGHPEEHGQPGQLSPKQKANPQDALSWKKTKVYGANFPGSSLGVLGTLPKELRKIIYEYAISVEPRSHGEPKSGLGLLATSALIYKEVIPLIYQSQLFSIEIDTESRDFAYKHIKPGREDISWGFSIEHLSTDLVDFVQNLHVRVKPGDEPFHTSLHVAMVKFCHDLQHNTHLQSLYISMEFPTSSKKDEPWATFYLLEPMKMLLRGGKFEITMTSDISDDNARNTRLIFAYNKRQ